MSGREKIFFIIERTIDGWLEIRTPDDASGDSQGVPISDEFFDALTKLLEDAIFDIVTVGEIKEAFELGKELLKQDEEDSKELEKEEEEKAEES